MDEIMMINNFITIIICCAISFLSKKGSSFEGLKSILIYVIN